MKRRYKIGRALLLCVLMGAFSLPSFAQFGDAGAILRSGQQDANVLLREYFKPVGKGFGFGLNTGWFSTAKAHGTLGFDLTFNAAASVVPDAGQLFNVQALESQLQEVEYVSNGPETPTVAGSDEPGAVIGSRATYTNPNTGQTERVFEFELPQGSGYPYIPGAMVQASVGLIKSTDITLRYLPSLSMPNDVEFNLYGVGVKHEINSWLPGGKLLPVDLSIQAGFTKLNASVGFDVQPQVDQDTENPYAGQPETWQGQKGEFSSNAFTINALVGKTLPVISFYGGVGFQTSTVNIGTPGSYPVVIPNQNYDPNDPNSEPKIVSKVDDPIDITYDDNSSFHALVGTRIKLLIFNISASYTLSEYPVAQVGFGFGIR